LTPAVDRDARARAILGDQVVGELEPEPLHYAAASPGPGRGDLDRAVFRGKTVLGETAAAHPCGLPARLV
jgi:hypothetical protein